MKLLKIFIPKHMRVFLDEEVEPLFRKGAKFEKFYPVYEMIDTILFSPAYVTKGLCHIRDGLEQKRMMLTVVFAMLFPLVFGLYNLGYQANTALTALPALLEKNSSDLRFVIMHALEAMGYFVFDPSSLFSNLVYGALYFFPILLVTLATGGIIEVTFAIIRRHEVTEGFLVSAFLITLISPPDVPLWQIALGTAFGVIVGKEVFGGVGFNVLNPALTARAFLFFAYPAEFSGDSVWVAVDGFTKATPLGIAALEGPAALAQNGYTWQAAFLGFIPGSIGETSTLACLLGAGILVSTGIGSWRVMLSILLSMFALVGLFNLLAPFTENPMFALSPFWHLVVGGYAFGLVYMATDPVSSAMTQKGKIIYGALIGVLLVLIRVVNPAYPEGMMLAILFMNVFAPVVDHYVVKANIERRKLRYQRG